MHGETCGEERRQETIINVIIEIELEPENRIIPTGMWRKYFNGFSQNR
jgi:hypothetical protein